MNYIFTSKRLGFRNWNKSDISKMAAINADPQVMEFFPSTATSLQTEELIIRMQKEFAEKGYCYFAVETIDTSDFIGFIGLLDQTYEAEFTPCVDIGWRLSKKSWGKGYATEGAKRCLEYAFNELKLSSVKAIATKRNTKSIRVMEKIGMKKHLSFKYPDFKDYKHLEHCECYEIKK